MKAILTSLVDSSKLGGWVRAIVASGLTMAIAKVPMLKDLLDPSTQAAFGVAISGVVVGLWSQYVKGSA